MGRCMTTQSITIAPTASANVEDLTALADIAALWPAGSPVFATAPEVALMLRISLRHVRAETACGIFPHTKMGASVRFSRDNVQTYIARCTVDRW